MQFTSYGDQWAVNGYGDYGSIFKRVVKAVSAPVKQAVAVVAKPVQAVAKPVVAVAKPAIAMGIGVATGGLSTVVAEKAGGKWGANLGVSQTLALPMTAVAATLPLILPPPKPVVETVEEVVVEAPPEPPQVVPVQVAPVAPVQAVPVAPTYPGAPGATSLPGTAPVAWPGMAQPALLGGSYYQQQQSPVQAGMGFKVAGVAGIVATVGLLGYLAFSKRGRR